MLLGKFDMRLRWVLFAAYQGVLYVLPVVIHNWFLSVHNKGRDCRNLEPLYCSGICMVQCGSHWQSK